MIIYFIVLEIFLNTLIQINHMKASVLIQDVYNITGMGVVPVAIVKEGTLKPGFKASKYTDGMIHEFLTDTVGDVVAKDLTPFFRYDNCY